MASHLPISSIPSLSPSPSKLSVTSLASSNSLFFATVPRASSLVAARGQKRRPSGALGARCLFGLGVPELVVIGGVAALLFGPKQLPQIGKSFGKTIKSFQQAAKEFETELKTNPEKSDEAHPAEDSTSTENAEKEIEVSSK